MRVLPFQEAAQIVKSTLDVVDVVSRHVVLKRQGRNYSGLCPFHPEKTPSFNVNREKNLYKCFGCGEAGDAIAFLMKQDNKTYGELIRDLARDQGIEIQYEGKTKEEVAEERDFSQKIIELNTRSAQWFEENLQAEAAQSVRDYLARRQIPADVIRQFGLGFAPPGWENLVQHLTDSVDFVQDNPDVLVAAGLANNRTEGQGFYDRFRNRLIIPIHDEQGRVVAFGGRSLSDEDKPKYLNSPETPVYFKSRILYGIHQARETIRQTRSAVVMEGYFDVIAAHMAGVTQAVGSCGTAMTESHLKLLTRFGAETVYLSFDSDGAGIKAALSAIELIEPYLPNTDLTLKILLVPDGKDPDDFVRTHGAEAFRGLLEKAVSYLDFRFETALKEVDTSTSEGRVQAAGKLTPLFARIRQPVLRSEYIRKYAQRVGVSEEALILELRRFEQAQNPGYGRTFPGVSSRYPKNIKKFGKEKAISDRALVSLWGNKNSNTSTDAFGASGRVAKTSHSGTPQQVRAEEELLRLMLMNTDSLNTVLPMLDESLFRQELCRDLLAKVRSVRDAGVDTLEALERQLSEVLVDFPHLQKFYANMAFSTEEFSEQLGLRNLSAGEFSRTVAQSAEKRLVLLENSRKKESLQAINRQLRTIETGHQRHEQVLLSQEPDELQQELSTLELQYQLREELARKRDELL